MIVGLGCDIVQISRFDKKIDFLVRFANKYFTLSEREELEYRKVFEDKKIFKIAVATRFAAKEAVAKALGCGFRNGITLRDIEIIHDSLGCPQVVLYNHALHRAYYVTKNQEFKMHLTLSNEQEYANAVAVLEIL